MTEIDRLRAALRELQLANAQLTVALRDVLSTAKASTNAAVAAMQRNEARAECRRLQDRVEWLERKVRFLEERLPEDPVLTCARCGPTPHRWRPSPEAGPHWRCSECGEITGPEGGAR